MDYTKRLFKTASDMITALNERAELYSDNLGCFAFGLGNNTIAITKVPNLDALSIKRNASIDKKSCKDFLSKDSFEIKTSEWCERNCRYNWEDVSPLAQKGKVVIKGTTIKNEVVQEFEEEFASLEELYHYITDKLCKKSLNLPKIKKNENGKYEPSYINFVTETLYKEKINSSIYLIKFDNQIIFSSGEKTDGIKHLGKRALYLIEKLNNWKSLDYNFCD